MRGLQSELPAGSGAAETCLASNYLPSGFDPKAVELADGTVPASGEAFWYLVRARNSCAIGTYGSTSAGEPRLPTACP